MYQEKGINETAYFVDCVKAVKNANEVLFYLFYPVTQSVKPSLYFPVGELARVALRGLEV